VTLLPVSPPLRFAVCAILAIVVPAAILAVLGYVSLRQWQVSADLLFQEQSRNMATMAAEKVDMALRHLEEDALAHLETVLASEETGPDAIRRFLGETPLVGRLALFDRVGRALYPPGAPLLSASAPGGPLAEAARALWERGGRRHVIVDDDLVVATVLRAPGHPSCLAIVVLDPAVLRREAIEKPLGGPDAPAVLAVTDHKNRPVYGPATPGSTDVVAAVPLGELLPAWRLALYQPADRAPRVALRRQMMLFSCALGLLLVVITAGIVATYRLVRHETEMARLKADFVANVSHDLKTPLSLIRVFGETLEMGRVADEPTRLEYYRVITRESERLSRLIDNVLDFSRIEGGRRTYDLVPLAVEPLVRETLEAFEYVLGQGGFRVEVTLPPDLPEVPMDGDAVGQALANLVDNAIKYSVERKALRVEAAVRDGHLGLVVADEGIGIPREEQGRIFDKFYRIGRSDTQGRRGSGVGLALVRHVAEAHGGRVTVESQPGQGSRFTLWLPLAGQRA
jgi:signal transduction histidine kinase